MACTDCKDSIISQTPSLIPGTKCNGDCPEEITCLDIIGSNCVFYSGANLTCSEINYGDTITEAIVKINAKLCEQDSCGVKVTSTDPCCGFLESKIVAGVGISIIKQTANPSGCERLLISTDPGSLTWTNINLPVQLTNLAVSGYQIPQYSNKDALGRVWFRGSFTFNTQLPSGNTINLSTTLPANSRPLATRLSTGGYFKTIINGTSITTPTAVLFLPTGVITVKNISGGAIDNKSIVTLDGFYIDTN